MNKQVAMLIPAKDWSFEVMDELGAYQNIGGINNSSLSVSTERTDATDFDSGGWESGIVVGRGQEITLSGFRLEDVTTKDRDAGQARIEALADQFGDNAFGNFRFTTPGGKKLRFVASIQIGSSGSDTEPVSWEATLKVEGEPDWS